MNQDLRDIMMMLIEKSMTKQVHWVHASTIGALNEQGDIDPAAQDFAVHAPTYTINIFERPDNNNIVVHLYNEYATLVTNEPVTPQDPFYSNMEILLNLARKYALGEDKLLKKIKESLQEPGILGSSAKEEIIDF